MDRKAVVKAVHELYESRLLNEVEPCLSRFSDDVSFQLAGSARASEIASTVSGVTAFRDLLGTLSAIWQWRNVAFKSILIDGNEAAVKYDLTTTFTPTNEEITTEIMDHIVFDSQLKAVSIVQFVDTALVQQLINRA